MEKIGSEKNAKLIRDWVASSRNINNWNIPEHVVHGDAPEGWAYLGRGSFRSAWLGPDGVVYKVGHQKNSHQQEQEVEKIQECLEKKQLPGCRIPRASEWRFDDGDEIVVSMEKVNGTTLNNYLGPDREEMYDFMLNVEKHFRLWDMHDQNIMVDEITNELVPVDFG